MNVEVGKRERFKFEGDANARTQIIADLNNCLLKISR